MQLSVYAGSTRFATREPDRVTHHSFSFGAFYDPDNVSFGPLVAHNDHHLSWGAGYPDHAHSEVELVTWVLRGALVHTDSLGNSFTLPAGSVQVQSAGSGITHAEFADTSPEPTRFVQAWLRPDEPGQPPARFSAAGLAGPGLVPVAGEGGQLPVGTRGATLWVGTLAAGTRHPLPAGPRHHLFVATGSVRLALPAGEPVALEGGDAVRLEGAEAGDDLALEAVTGAEVLLWTLPA